MSTCLATTYPLFPSLLPVKHWSKILSMSARDTTPIAPLMGEDENSIIEVKAETEKDKSDRTAALLARLAGDGLIERVAAIG